MLRRVQGYIFCSTESNANSVRSDINLELIGKIVQVTFKELSVVSPDRQTQNRWVVSFDLGMLLALDADTIYSKVQDRWKGGSASARRYLAGSWVQVHDCYHDELMPRGGSVPPATDANFVKAVK